jgi:hypothetical protein
MSRCSHEEPMLREVMPRHQVACHLYDEAPTLVAQSEEKIA